MSDTVNAIQTWLNNPVSSSQAELAPQEPPSEPLYKLSLENRVWLVVKEILSWIIFPIGLYRLIHRLIGMGVVPACIRTDEDMDLGKHRILGIKTLNALRVSNATELQRKGFETKRLAIEVDGYVIDAMMIGKKETLKNGKWAFFSNGNGETYEEHIGSHDFQQILTHFQGNALVFNYVGVMGSLGMPSRSALEKTEKAMLTFLEDAKNGIGAKTIGGYGHSIGGAVQAMGLEGHKFKEGITYRFVKSRTFSTTTHFLQYPSDSSPENRSHRQPGHATAGGRVMAFFAKLFHWNMDSVSGCKKLKKPELILQHATGHDYTPLKKVKKGEDDAIRDDEVISSEASLAQALLNEETLENKTILGIPETHNEGLTRPDLIGRWMNGEEINWSAPYGLAKLPLGVSLFDIENPLRGVSNHGSVMCGNTFSDRT